MTLFKDKYSIVNLNIDDKIIIYKFYKEIANSDSLHKFLFSLSSSKNRTNDINNLIAYEKSFLHIKLFFEFP